LISTLKRYDRPDSIGPNGAGKTTFFNGMTGVYHITSGEMVFDGKNITQLKPFQITALELPAPSKIFVCSPT